LLSPESAATMVPGARNTKDQPILPYVRRAHFAGSWYDADPSELDKALSTYLDEAQQNTNSMSCTTEVLASGRNSYTLDVSPSIRAIIAPHAGYRYSGPTAAYSYLALKEFFQEASLRFHDHENKKIESTKYITIVVLHPSHNCYLDGCAISGASSFETPFSTLNVDEKLRLELFNTGDFSIMDRHMDEAEHSGEMQYPYIAKMYQEYVSSLPSNQTNIIAEIRLLPIMVGAISTSKEEYFGTLLSPFLSRSSVCTIISSDFCHWGSRFRFSPMPTQPQQEIYEYIEWLDRLGMNYISLQQPGAFATYLKQYNNTICGRHPIGVWLHSITRKDQPPLEVTFVHYQQSSLVRISQDTSVSYAAAIAKLCNQRK